MKLGSTSMSALHVVNAEEEEEVDVLIYRLYTTITRYKIEFGHDKTKVMTNNPSELQKEITIQNQRIEAVENIKRLESVIPDDGPKPKTLPRATSYGAYISQLIRFAKVSSHVADFNTRNQVLTAKLHHKIRKTFSKFYRRH